MSIYRPAPPALEPEIYLTHWKVFEIAFEHAEPSRHIVGTVANGDGRVSSPVQTSTSAIFKDPVVLETRSGRQYQLEGSSTELDPDAHYVLQYWLRANDAHIVSDVSTQYVPSTESGQPEAMDKT